MKNYDQLIVWQKALKLVGEIQESIRRFPVFERDTLGKQMSRAAISIVSNIAEGKHRSTRREYAQFINIAYASGKELESQLRIAGEFKCVSRVKENEFISRLDEILRMLWVLNRNLS